MTQDDNTLTLKKAFLLPMLCLCLSCNTNERDLLKKNENLQIKVDSLTELLVANDEYIKEKMDSLTQSSVNKEAEANYWFIPTYDGKKLLKNGIHNPEDYIENALRQKPELIPLKAVLGGTMRYGTIQVLSDKWLIADFNDGHIEGKAIYRYKLIKNGELDFEILDRTANSQ